MMIIIPYSDTAASVFDSNLRKCVYLQSVTGVFVRELRHSHGLQYFDESSRCRDAHRMRNNNIIHTFDNSIIIIPLKLYRIQ